MFHVQILNYYTLIFMKLHPNKIVKYDKSAKFSPACVLYFLLTNKVVSTLAVKSCSKSKFESLLHTQKVQRSILTPSNQMAGKIPSGGIHQCSAQATHRQTDEGTFLWITEQKVSGWG